MITNSVLNAQARSKLAQFIDKRLAELRGTTTLLEIARKMGYLRKSRRGNVIPFRADVHS
jgi:hypothetical protein